MIPRSNYGAILGFLSCNISSLAVGPTIRYSCSWTFLCDLRVGLRDVGLRASLAVHERLTKAYKYTNEMLCAIFSVNRLRWSYG